MAVANFSSSSSTESSMTSTPDSFKFETKYIVLSFLNQLTKTNNHDAAAGLQDLQMSSTDSEQRTRKYFKIWKEKHPHPPHMQKRKSNNETWNKKKTSHLSNENLRKSSSHDSSFVNKPVSRKAKAVRKYSLPLSPDHIKSTASTPALLSRSISNGCSHDHDDGSSHGHNDGSSYCSDADDELDLSQESSVAGSSLGMYSSRTKEDIHRLSTVVSESETEPDGHTKCSREPVSLDMISLDKTFLCRSKSGQSNSSSSKNSAFLDDVDGKVCGDCVDGDNNTASDFTDSDVDLSEELGAKSGGEDDNSAGNEAAALPNGTGGVIDRSCLFLNLDGNNAEFGTPVELESVVLSLKEEVQEQMISLESEYEDAIKSQRIPRVESPFECPLTPQSECARILATIGDDIDIQHRERIASAVGHLFTSSSGIFSYDAFLNMAKDVVDENMPGWRQVVILLMYSQGVAIRLVHNGHRGISQIVDYSVQLLTDLTANFIIKQGGWGAIMNSDPSLTSTTSQSSPEACQTTNPFIIAMLKQQRTEQFTEECTEACTEQHIHTQRESQCFSYRQTSLEVCVTRTADIAPTCNISDDVQPLHTSDDQNKDEVSSRKRHPSKDMLNIQSEEVAATNSEQSHTADNDSSWLSRSLTSGRRFSTTAHVSTTFVLLAAGVAVTIAYFKSRSG